jgi:hypothetical protein
MKDSSVSFVRLPDEKAKFRHLLQMLIWAKGKTGKSSAEVAGLILRRGRENIERHGSSGEY